MTQDIYADFSAFYDFYVGGWLDDLPFYAFNYLLTPARQEAALRRIHAHLAAGGRLLVDVFVPWRRIEECPSEPVLRREAVDPATGRKVRALVGYRMDLARRLERRRHIFEFATADGGVERREFTTTRRYFLRGELEELFRSQGLAVEAVYGGYRREPAEESAEQMLYVLSRAV